MQKHSFQRIASGVSSFAKASADKLASRNLVSGVLASILTFSVLIPAIVAYGGTNEAVTYLQSKPLNPWSIMGLVASGHVPSDLSSLTGIDSAKAIDYEAPTMALAAAGKDPRTYPATDYVAKIKSFWDGTQLGDGASVNDDIFGALALSAAGVANTDPVMIGLKSYITARQNTDGGFPFSVAGSSDTNITAAAIMALLEIGTAKTEVVITKAVGYLQSAQNADGGFPSDPHSPWGTDSDASSDAWILMAINRLGDSLSSWTKNGKTPQDHLLGLQAESGFFKWQSASAEDQFSPATTGYALIALLSRFFPVAKFTAPVAPHVSYRIAGSVNDCIGETYAINPLELVKNAAENCGIDYHLTHYSFGDYLDRIGSDTASGNNGWMYYVNNVSPSVGADSYLLKAEDTVLWFFSGFDDKITRLQITSAQVSSGNAAIVTVEYLDGSTWRPLAGASIHAGNTVVATGIDGNGSLTLPDGSYKLYATKVGYVRSEQQTINFGATSQTDLNLSADLGGTVIGGNNNAGGSGTLSFTLTPAAAGSDGTLKFGAISKGQNKVQEVTIANKSSLQMYFESIVSGDKVFTTYLTVDGTKWRAFNDKLNANGTKTLSVGLNVPADYPDSGVKAGKLTIWAASAN